MSDPNGNTFQELGADSEAADILKDKDPLQIFFQLSKKIDSILHEVQATKKIAEFTSQQLSNPDDGIIGRVKTIEEWKKELLFVVDQKIEHCRATCRIEDGPVRLTTAENSIEQIKKLQWLLFSVLTTGGVGILAKGLPSILQFLGVG